MYYIISTLQDKAVPIQLKSTIKTDIFKCMLIGSVFMMTLKYVRFNHYYMFKEYIHSLFVGSIMGVGYSPLFVTAKID